MMSLLRPAALALVVAILCVPQPAAGQSVNDAITLASNNTASANKQAFGGTYIFAQICSGYGTVQLQVLGPDGVTWQTIASKTQADATGGTELKLGTAAIVRVTLSGTTGCSAQLSRVP